MTIALRLSSEVVGHFENLCISAVVPTRRTRQKHKVLYLINLQGRCVEDVGTLRGRRLIPWTKAPDSAVRDLRVATFKFPLTPEADQ